tara:strand:+ start:5031 stop:5231 length:201 start_codon:yes stop_codon:yes gene_type:complete
MTSIIENKPKQRKANIGDFVMKFGKHKGKKFSQVKKEYLQWCLETDIFADDNYKWNAQIRNYIEQL